MDTLDRIERDLGRGGADAQSSVAREGEKALAVREQTAKEELSRLINRMESDLANLRQLRDAIPDNYPSGADRGLRLLVVGASTRK